MGIYQRDERWMVYFWENGKRHDRSFGKGETGHAKAVAFDEAVKSKKNNTSHVLQPTVTSVQPVPV